jgi:hypothetical protein
MLLGKAGNIFETAMQIHSSASDRQYVYLVSWLPLSGVQSVVVYHRMQADSTRADASDASVVSTGPDQVCRLRCKVEVSCPQEIQLQFDPFHSGSASWSNTDRYLRIGTIVGASATNCSPAVLYTLAYSFHACFILQRVVLENEQAGMVEWW